MSQALAAPANRSIARQWDAAVLALALVYFVVRAGYYAANIAPTVPPDETAHFAISEIFAKSMLLPNDSPESYRYGLVTHSPSLYYYLMGRVANVNFAFDSDLRWMRFANILLGALTVVFGYLWMRLFTTNTIARALFAVMATNIPMFTFLSASVSYDNLANLFAAMSVYFLTLFFHGRRGTQLGLFFLALLLGSLSKYTFLPLAAILLLVLLVHERRSLQKLPRLIIGSLRPFTLKRLALPVAVLLLSCVTLYLYGGNLLRYRRLVPNPQQVLTLDQCLQNPIFARDFIAQEFRQGRMTLQEAFGAASRIDDDGIKAALAEMLNEAIRKSPPTNEKPAKPNPGPKKQSAPAGKRTTSSIVPSLRMTSNVVAAVDSGSPPKTNSAPAPAESSISIRQYASFWTARIAETTFRILAQPPAFRTNAEFQDYLNRPEFEKWSPPNPAFKSQTQLYGYGAIFGLAFIMFFLTQLVPGMRRRRDFGFAMSAASAAVIVLFYALLLFWLNFNSYSTTGLAALAVQGRYLFPVFVPTYGLTACLLVGGWPKRLQAALALLVGIWFVYGDIPFYLASLSPHWFA